MPASVGIDVGATSIKVAVVEGTAKAPRVVHFATHRLEADRQGRQLGAGELADLLRGVAALDRIPAGNVVAAMPAASCLAREVTAPFTREDQLRKTIKFQAESVFHAVSIDDLIVDFYKLAEHGEKSRLLVLGMKKSLIRDRLDAFAGADLDPAALDLDAAALYSAMTLLPAVKEGKRVLGVDLGGASMKMVAIEDGKLRGLRSTRLQASGLKIGEKKAPSERRGMSLEELKRNMSPHEREDTFFADPGQSDEGRLPVVILDEEQSELFDFAEAPEAERLNVLEKVFLEIDRTLASVRLDGPVHQVYILGGGASVEGVEKVFAEHFAAPCERVSFKGAVPGKLARTQAEQLDLLGGVALGLALKGIGYDPARIDFRKEEFTYQGKFERAKRGVACGLVLLFVLFFVVAYRFQMIELQRLLTKQDFLLGFQRDIYVTMFPEEANRPGPENPLGTLNKRAGELRQRLKGFDVPDVVSALDMLRDISQGIQESGKKVLLKEASLRQANSSIKLAVDGELDVYAIKEAVNKPGPDGKPRGTGLTIEEGPIQKDPKSDKYIVTFRVNLPEKKKTPPRPGAPAPREED